MSKDYWFPFYPSRFKADTMHLNDEQELIYRRIIDFYMETGGSVPDNDQALANIARITLEKFQHSADVIKGFFSKANGKLQLKKCDGILADQTSRKKSYSERGKKGGRGKTNENNAIKATAKQNASTEHNSTEHSKDKKEITVVSTPKKSNGTRVIDFLPDGKIPAEFFEWAKSEYPAMPPENIIQHWKQFYDYWLGISTNKSVKSDWFATWRNGLRNQLKWDKKDEPANKPTKTDRAKAALFRSSQALGFAGQSSESATTGQSDLSVFSGFEAIREGTGGTGEHKSTIPARPSGLSFRENTGGDGFLPALLHGNADTS